MNLLDLYLNNNGALGMSVPEGINAQQTTQQTKDRVYDATMAQLGKNATSAAAGTFANVLSGMPTDMVTQSLMGGLMGPGAMTGLMSAPAKAAFGVAPEGFLGNLASMGVKGLAGAFGGPIGAVAAGLMGDFAIDGLMDFADARKDEKKRDDMEDTLGWGPGHKSYADEKSVRARQQMAQSPIAGLAGALATRQAIQNVYDHYGYSTPYDRAMASTMSGGMGNTYGGRGDFAGLDLSGGYGNTTYGVGPFRDLDFSVAANAFGLGGLGGFGGSNDGGYGGFGQNDGNSDTAGNAGYGR